MAEDFIEEIYKKAYLITLMKKLAENCRKKKKKEFYEQWKESTEVLAEVCRDTAQIDAELGVRIWDELQDACKCIDADKFAEVADRLEGLIPKFYKVVELVGNIDVTDDTYRIHSTKSGFLNIEFINNNVKMYGDNDPVWESYELAKALYQPKMKKFILVGAGLGYLPWQMYEIAQGSVDICIYDIEKKLVEYARKYGALDKIPEDRISVNICRDINGLLQSCLEEAEGNDDEYVLYIDDYFYGLLAKEEKGALQQLKLTIQTNLDFGDMCELNYYKNNSAVEKNIAGFDFSKYSKEWIVVGGGPSLDENLEYLKGQKNKKTIIAVTTVFRKLIDLGVEPDFVAVQDPQNRTYGHMANIEKSNATLFLTENSNWQFGLKYKGEKYLIKTDGNYYSQNNLCELWETSGTVTALAIDIAAYAGAETIELIGADLSYPGKQSHASGTMDNVLVDTTGMVKVKSVDGGEVPTSILFKGYISDIEKQIKKYKEVKFSNMSKHGALIRGCTN